MILLTGFPQNPESKCVIEGPRPSVVSTEVQVSRNDSRLGRKTNTELRFPPHRAWTGEEVNVTLLQ